MLHPMVHVMMQLAPAKVNLALSVGSPLENGMHPICSWMMTFDLCDELQLTKLSPGSLSRYAIYWHRNAKQRSEINWSIKDDLAVMAHLALEKAMGRDLPLQMRLEKKIPVGGGLGGGSSDAGAMLRGVNELYELGLSSDELIAIGSSLGSDVSFLVHGGSAIVQGLGDQIERHASTPEINAVLAFPEFQCETPRVYGLFDEHIKGIDHQLRVDEVIALAQSVETSSIHDTLFNDLAIPSMKSAPRLKGLVEKLSALAERPAHVSGSGSSLFVICDDAMHAQALAKATTDKVDIQAIAVTSHSC
ncbi:MAG: 4-(cytidine 5'-diphospho)-2-C-methyl-D-erythritol kinase [Planctomycetota bacterium]|nr:4-(cytidine 5'-diphospho)-2-C-methyl-D-erythritol kinase [Planctomycetota bacterium]